MSEVISDINPVPDSKEAVVRDSEIGIGNSRAYRPTKWQSNLTLLSCYIANFSDGYQNGLANPTNVIFKMLLGAKGYPAEIQTRISNSLLIGAILGVIVFGYVTDMVSRRAGLLFTSFLVTISTLMATLALQVPSSNMLWFFVIVRGICGFGVGGEYPPSAAAGLEESDDFARRYRGPIFISFTTLMATVASPVQMIIYLICLKASNNNLPVTFRALYSIATILPAIIMVLRFFMVDSTLYHHSNFKSQKKKPLRFYWLLICRYRFRLFTTSLAFFLYDFINFPNGIMSSTIISSLVKDGNIQTSAIWQVILAVLPVPGVVVGAWLSNVVGRRYTGIIGFAGYVVLGFIIGGTYSKLSNHIAAFVVLYGLLQAFGHMGPGATIGLISSEAFPTAMRGMGYSVSNAFGRTGAAVGTECFTPLEQVAGKSSTFYLAGGVGVLGMIVYWFLPESGDVNLEEEDANLAKYMAEHGFSMNTDI
ncbi:uncharacterized protein BHQ10_001934 [Talaromyces amestolkiae]|uniref:Major facilitator superfamily (MFS) profile domain-containing protein n=1 Tax=Talaromyces amestolkiae TaxID=1196081 RepID=A0A364KQU5_TALAM|nr:uncharacterized protein BHQ10_001934 [Talaromyces amestolkiae]RAO65922.1 hypothetical protein BHQ10_001934 [Talaromyces amestolkiae]